MARDYFLKEPYASNPEAVSAFQNAQAGIFPRGFFDIGFALFLQEIYRAALRVNKTPIGA